MITLKITRPTPDDPVQPTASTTTHPISVSEARRHGFLALADGATEYTISIEDECGNLEAAFTYHHNGGTQTSRRKTNP